jgi:hypothetical protein
MKIPNNMSEQEVLDIIEKVVSKISYKFVFGFYQYEDIKQQAWIYAIEGLENYKPDLPLQNFLCVHVKNRLCNFKRNNFVRLDKPCLHCPLGAWVKKGDICKKFEDKMDCEPFAKWTNKNQTKQNIIKPVNIGVVVDHQERNMYTEAPILDNIANAAIIEVIDRKLCGETRILWLKAKGGVKIHKEEQERLRDEILLILGEAGINVAEAW